jgi:hypothetical protein
MSMILVSGETAVRSESKCGFREATVGIKLTGYFVLDAGEADAGEMGDYTSWRLRVMRVVLKATRLKSWRRAET